MALATTEKVEVDVLSDEGMATGPVIEELLELPVEIVAELLPVVELEVAERGLTEEDVFVLVGSDELLETVKMLDDVLVLS